MNINEVLRKPVITEKGVTAKDEHGTLCFQVALDANKTQIKQAVQRLFKVKVAEVRTATFEGKMRRHGRYLGHKSDWKKAYIKLKEGEKVPDFAQI